MRIIMEKTAIDGSLQRDEIEATPEAIAEGLAAGASLRPLQKNVGPKASFLGADWAFVQLEGAADRVNRLLGHDFTVANAGAACVVAGTAGVRCILGFGLPHQVQSVADYHAVLAGLAVIYGI